MFARRSDNSLPAASERRVQAVEIIVSLEHLQVIRRLSHVILLRQAAARKPAFKVRFSMKVVIFGSRTITDFALVELAVSESGIFSDITEIVSGLAKGVDNMAVEYARAHGFNCREFPADWKRFGCSAGYRRNEEMAAYADFGVAVWDGSSRGTHHMMKLMTGRCHVFFADPAATPGSGPGSGRTKPELTLLKNTSDPSSGGEGPA